MKKALFLAAAGAVAAAAGAAVLYAGNYFYNFALNPKSLKPANPDDPTMDDPTYNPFAVDAKWRAERSPSDVFITSEDKYRLHAVLDDKIADRFIIICHGYICDSSSVYAQARHFTDMGYGVLIPDARGHGQSDGNYIGMGWHDRRDILEWIDFLNSSYNNPRIALYGISMGAATVMMTTGESLPKNVVAAIEDCGYSSIREEFTHNLKFRYGLPSFPILNAANLFAKARAGYSVLREGDAAAQVAKSVTPTLFIHGDADTFVPFWMLDRVYRAASCEKEKAVFEGSKHAMSQFDYPERYWALVKKFLDKHMI